MSVIANSFSLPRIRLLRVRGAKRKAPSFPCFACVEHLQDRTAQIGLADPVTAQLIVLKQTHYNLSISTALPGIQTWSPTEYCNPTKYIYSAEMLIQLNKSKDDLLYIMTFLKLSFLNMK